MADELRQIIVIHTTSTRNDADTDENFNLIASTPNGDVILTFREWPDPHEERDRGRTDEYRFDTTERGITTESRLRIKIAGDNGWLPRSIYAIGETVSREFVLLAVHPEWEDSNNWFDAQHVYEHYIN